MALYFKDIEITNIDNLVPQTGLDVTDIWFRETNVYTVWQTYEGTLPATINANGDNLRQYQVWGNTGGVGDKTINYFDYTQLVDGYTYDNNGQMILNPDEVSRWKFAAIPFIQVTPGATYLRTWNLTPLGNVVNYYDSEKNFILQTTPGTGVPFMIPNNCHFITYVADVSKDRKKYMLTEGSAPPASFVPFGYEVDIGVKSVNIFNADIVRGSIFTADGVNFDSTTRLRSGFEDYMLPAGTYTLSAHGVDKVTTRAYNSSKDYVYGASIIDQWQRLPFTFTINNDYYMRFVFSRNDDSAIYVNDISNVTLTEGSTPLPYQPYSNTTTPIYIGDEPLDKDEYIDYQAGKIYRMIDGTLTPIDPPVTLPALPTVDGTTIVDYIGSGTAPEKAILKYRKKNF